MAYTQVIARACIVALLASAGILVYIVSNTYITNARISAQSLPTKTSLACGNIKAHIPNSWKIKEACTDTTKQTTITDPTATVGVTLVSGIKDPTLSLETIVPKFILLDNKVVFLDEPYTVSVTESKEGTVVRSLVSAQPLERRENYPLYQLSGGEYTTRIMINSKEFQITLNTPVIGSAVLWGVVKNDIMSLVNSLE